MSLAPLTAGFIPLVDAAPLIVARELGFAEEEGLDLRLEKAPSWSTLRDRLALGGIEAAHMLAPVPIAMALGLGGLSQRIDVLSVLSTGGNVIGLSRTLAARLRAQGHGFGFDDAFAAGHALCAACPDGLRVGVPFPFSMHALMLDHWLGAVGMPVTAGVQIRTVPPPLMAQAMAEDEIDAFCVGEPWGSIAVENGVGELLLPGSAIRPGVPEKVLAVRHDWAEAEPDLTGRLMRAIWRAGRWLGDPAGQSMATELLSRSAYLGVSAEVIERAMAGRFLIGADGSERETSRFLNFFDGGSTFPWRSQAAWIGARFAARAGVAPEEAMTTAAGVFRTDLYRRHLRSAGADLPGASEKLEGAVTVPTEVPSVQGRMILAPDAFFDGTIFDPRPTE